MPARNTVVSLCILYMVENVFLRNIYITKDLEMTLDTADIYVNVTILFTIIHTAGGNFAVLKQTLGE